MLAHVLDWVLPSPEIAVASAEYLEDCFWVHKVQGWTHHWKEHALSLPEIKLHKSSALVPGLAEVKDHH